MTTQDWLSGADQIDDPEAATSLLLESAGITGEGADLVRPLVRQEVVNRRRARTRHLERTSMIGLRVVSESVVTQRAKLANEFFVLADGRLVSWAQATVADHEERIAMQLRLIGGIEETIVRHREAIDVISEAGVSCLAEVAGWLPVSA